MLCLSAGAATVWLALSSFTLAWTHSVERIRWEEDWIIRDGKLVPVESRVQGSGAGMEVPDGAVLEGGAWRYRPSLPPLPELLLARSGAVPDWQLCHAGYCRDISALLPWPATGEPLRLAACAPVGGRSDWQDGNALVKPSVA